MKSEDVALIARTLRSCFISPNVSDSNMEAANLVDVLDDISRALWKIADIFEKANTTPAVPSEPTSINSPNG